jgi:hypothetical protein
MTVHVMQRKQTGEFTCGAAALAVALAEIAAAPEWNSDQQEEIIWRGVRGVNAGWSVPGKLALHAWKGGPSIRAAIWQDDERLASLRAAIPSRVVGFDVDAYLQEHNEALDRAERSGVTVAHGTHDVTLLTSLMDAGWRLLVVVIVPSASGLGLHYLLGRKKSDVYGYAVMDPATGHNAPYFHEDLNSFLFGPAPELSGLHRYIGITVGLLDYVR